MPGICACACVYRTSVNQALGKSEDVTAQGSYADCCSNDGGEVSGTGCELALVNF